MSVTLGLERQSCCPSLVPRGHGRLGKDQVDLEEEMPEKGQAVSDPAGRRVGCRVEDAALGTSARWGFYCSIWPELSLDLATWPKPVVPSPLKDLKGWFVKTEAGSCPQRLDREPVTAAAGCPRTTFENQGSKKPGTGQAGEALEVSVKHECWPSGEEGLGQ